jgi:hypothetical protein
MNEEPKTDERQSSVLPFAVIGLLTCIATYPVILAIKIWLPDRPPWPEFFYRPAIILACCWALFAASLWIASRLGLARRK